VKLSICQVITLENRLSGVAVVRQSLRVIGCHVECHVKSPTGIADAGVPMFEPNVKRWVKCSKNATYHASFFAIASCVNAGSESMKTRCGMPAYSSRQNHDPPERFVWDQT